VPQPPVLAAIDCGTNSTRLLVARGAGADKEPLARINTITRLGRGVDATGRLDPASIERTVEAMRRYREVADAHGVERLRVTATSAARDATNRDEFFDAAEAVLGVRPELLSGAEEAELSFLGATAELDRALGPFLVVDIGGGSTELIVGTDRVEGSRSIDIGCVRFFEQYIEHDPPAPEELHACISVTQQWMDDVVRDVPGIRDATTFVGLAGTITTMAAVEIGLAEWDRDAIHHFRFERPAIEDVFRTLVTEPLADRVHNPGLEEARADVIVAGACIFAAIVRWLDADECLVSESDILDGLVASLGSPGRV
jgi:exopolyphosphatase / guanosine-5'-triphosphate,3'-diphosphate pyrophosphatase